MNRRIKINSPVKYKLDIGCKTNTKPGCIGIDMVDFGQEVIWDITEGLPFPDGSVDYVYMSHFVEHIEERFVAVLFKEIYRVSVNGTVIDIIVPHAATADAYRLAHVSYWNESRIEGITRSIKGWLKIEDMHRKGIELRAKLRVVKNGSV